MWLTDQSKRGDLVVVETIIEIVGARPNFPKIAPIHRLLALSDSLKPMIVHPASTTTSRCQTSFCGTLRYQGPNSNWASAPDRTQFKPAR